MKFPRIEKKICILLSARNLDSPHNPLLCISIHTGSPVFYVQFLELCHKVLYPPYWPRVHDRIAVAVVMAVVVVVLYM